METSCKKNRTVRLGGVPTVKWLHECAFDSVKCHNPGVNAGFLFRIFEIAGLSFQPIKFQTEADLLQALKNGSVDMSLSTLNLKSGLLDNDNNTAVLSPSAAVDYFRMGIMVKKHPEYYLEGFWMLRPFGAKDWLFGLLSMVAIAWIMSISLSVIHKPCANDSHRMESTFSETFWTLIRSLTAQSDVHAVFTLPESFRVALVMWEICKFIFLAIYASVLVSFLSVSISKTAVLDIDDAIEQVVNGHLKLVRLDKMEECYVRASEFFKEILPPYLYQRLAQQPPEKIYECGIPQNEIPNFIAGSSKHIAIASRENLFLGGQHNKYVEILEGPSALQRQYVFLFRHDFGCKNVINDLINGEDNAYTYFIDKYLDWTGQTASMSSVHAAYQQKITTQHLHAITALLIPLLFLAFVVLFCERISWKRQKVPKYQKRKSLQV